MVLAFQKLRSCKFRYLFDINEGLGMLRLADKVLILIDSLILINTSPSTIMSLLNKQATLSKQGGIFSKNS